jgi:hypothetical protein
MAKGKAKNAKAQAKSQPEVPSNLANAVKRAVMSGLKAIPKGTLAKIGGFAGPGGAALGQAASTIFGVGDYEVSGGATTFGGEVPHFTNMPDKTIIKHREFVAAVKSPGTDFTNTTYDINPGNSSLFPWLSTVARSYQQYKILGMVAIYKPLTSDYAASGGLGQVILATNYNVNDPAYSSAIQMENSEYAVAVKPSKGALHVIECASARRRNDPFYVYDPNADSGAVSDKRFYDMGKLQVATEGLSTTADVTIGQLWVTYEIELIKPVLPASVVPPAPTDRPFYPGYWSAGSWATTTWTENLGLTGVTVYGEDVSTSVKRLHVTVTGAPVGSKVIIMYQVYGNAFVSAVPGSNLDMDPASDVMHHSQESDYIHGNDSTYQVCGHAVGTVVEATATSAFQVTVQRLSTDPTAMTATGGWVYVYLQK